jgi:hypothetical protein
MKIRKYVEFHDEIEIDLSTEDFRGILTESEITDDDHRCAVLSTISTALGVLQNIPDKWMNEFNGNVRSTIVTNLKKALEMWEKQD